MERKTEFLRKAGQIYPAVVERDVFGRRPASPKEIAIAIEPKFVEAEPLYPPTGVDIAAKEEGIKPKFKGNVGRYASQLFEHRQRSKK